MHCYAEYITDIIDGQTFFDAVAATENGVATDVDKENVVTLLQELETSENIGGAEALIQYDKQSKEYNFAYHFSSFLALEAFEYVNMKKAGAKIMKCQNPECGKYFVAQRSTAKYCPYASPQDSKRSCKLYYPQIRHGRNKTNNEGYRLYRKTLSKLSKRRQNHPRADYYLYQPDIDLLKEKYNNIYKPGLEKGEFTIQDFTDWLKRFDKEKKS